MTDFSGFGEPIELKAFSEEGASSLAIEGDRLYVAGRYYMSVYDIGEPLKPRLLGRLDGLAGGRQIAVRNRIAYITGRNYGLWIVDARDSAAPRLLAHVDTIELATGVDVCGSLLFLAERVYGIEILDVSDPAEPRFLSRICTTEAQSCMYLDGKLYVGDWGVGKLVILDVSDPFNPKPLGEGTLDGFGDGVFAAGKLCYCSTGHNAKYSGEADDRAGRGRGMEIFDISDPVRPKRIGGLKFRHFTRKENDYWTLRVSGSTAYCADSHNGFYRLNVSDPASPRATGHARLPEYRQSWEVFNAAPVDDCVAGLAVGEGVVYLAGLTRGLYLFADIEAHGTTNERPRLELVRGSRDVRYPAGLLRYDLGGMVHRVAVSGDLLFAAVSNAGLQIFRLTEERLSPLPSRREVCVHDVSVLGDVLFAAENYRELGMYRIHPDGGLTELARFVADVEDSLQVIHPLCGGKFLAFSGGAGRFAVLDISDFADIRVVFRGGIPGILYCDQMPYHDSNGLFPVNWHCRGLTWTDLRRKPPEMICQGSPRMGNQLNGIDFKDDKLITAINENTLGITSANEIGKELERVALDGADPAFPLGGVPTVSGGLAAFADRRQGRVVLLDVSDLKRPRVLRNRCYAFPKGDICERVTFQQGRMLIPAGYAGLFLEPNVGRGVHGAVNLLQQSN